MVAVLPRLNKYLHVKQTRHLIFLVRSLSCSSASRVENYWDYSPSYGPTRWEKYWKTGQRQSPIDLCSKTANYDSLLGSFDIDEAQVHFKASNVGNNVSLTPRSEKKLLLKGGSLTHHVYQFGEMHMHWGEMDLCGCEHTLDGKRFAGELHLVHWNTEYRELANAVDKPDGLAVLGVFLDAQKHHVCHPGLDLILDMFDKVHNDGSTTNSLTPFSPYKLLPKPGNAYFTYLGSLTTPPLFESVTWTVFMDPLKISTKQWERLNGVITSKNIDGEDRFCKQCAPPDVISNNFRPVQPLNDRVVRVSVDLSGQ